MSGAVDLRDLAIDRTGADRASVRGKRHVWTRYVFPAALVAGFLLLIAWAGRDYLFPPHPVTVVRVFSTTAEVRQEGAPLFQAAGWIEPRPTPVRVAALAPGVVEQLLVVEDQPVKAGEPIAELVKEDAKLIHERALADARLREAELDEAKSSLKAATVRFEQPVHLEAALAEAEALLAGVETSLANLPFEIRRAEADLKAAKQDYDGKAAARGVVAGVKIDIAKSTFDSSAALVEELRGRRETLQQQRDALGKRRDALETQLELLADETKAKEEADARVKAAAARVEQARVAAAESQLQLDRMTVRSPIDGRVYRLIAEPGSRLGAGMTQMVGYDGSTVVTLYRPDSLQVRVDVRFEDVPHVSLGQPVQINNPALDEPLDGNVLFISSEADIQKNTLQVKVGIADPPPVFKPEMLVDVTFIAPRPDETADEPAQELKLYVLNQFIHQEDGNRYVWLADRSAAVAVKQPVETGATATNGLVEITDGLTIASWIISSGAEGLEDGGRIRVTSDDDAGSIAPARNRNGPPGTLNRLPTGDRQQ